MPGLTGVQDNAIDGRFGVAPFITEEIFNDAIRQADQAYETEHQTIPSTIPGHKRYNGFIIPNKVSRSVLDMLNNIANPVYSIQRGASLLGLSHRQIRKLNKLEQEKYNLKTPNSSYLFYQGHRGPVYRYWRKKKQYNLEKKYRHKRHSLGRGAKIIESHIIPRRKFHPRETALTSIFVEPQDGIDISHNILNKKRIESKNLKLYKHIVELNRDKFLKKNRIAIKGYEHYLEKMKELYLNQPKDVMGIGDTVLPNFSYVARNFGNGGLIYHKGIYNRKHVSRNRYKNKLLK